MRSTASTPSAPPRLRCAIVAEGVEEARHVQILQGLGCDQGQGYHFSRPVPEAELIPLFQQATFSPT